MSGHSFRGDKARQPHGLGRRSVLIGGGAAIGLAIAWGIWPRDYAHNLNLGEGEHAFNAWLKIGEDGRVIAIVPQAELGQGVTTLLPQIMADELGADWRTVAVETAPINPLYANRLIAIETGRLTTPRALVPDAVGDVRTWLLEEYAVRETTMMTARSSSVRAFEQPCREAAALARMMLVAAAAERWDVPAEQCATASGFVLHGNKRLRFGDIAAAAARQPVPDAPVIRKRTRNALYGQNLPRLDLPGKVDGSANFAGDIRLPDMLFAAIRHGPHGDTRLVGIDKLTQSGTDQVRVIEHDRWVATVASSWWSANRALDRLAPRFETTGRAASSTAIERDLRRAVSDGEGVRIAKTGDTAAAFSGRKALTADYYVAPALHAAIETRTATARVANGTAQIWVATQAPAAARAAVARALDFSATAVTILPMFAGGSFDAALEHDTAVEAAIIAQKIGAPVQLIRSRAEEIISDLPRAPAAARMAASLNSAGTIDAWSARIATQASTHEFRARLDGKSAHDALRASDATSDAGALEGAMPPYAIPHVAIDHLPAAAGLPAGQWRGNADSYTCFFTESFVDDLAREVRADPLSYRISMLAGKTDLARCLARAGVVGEWEGGQAGSTKGLAIHSMRGSHIACIADARFGPRGLQVRRLVAVVDCGRLVNPDIARQQIEGGLVFGLAALVGTTTRYRNGLATARRMADLRLPGLAQSPEIIVEFIASDRDPGGVGELGVPVIGPAIANAIATGSGRRLSSIPFRFGNTQ